MAWRKLPLSAADWPALERNPAPWAGLLSSLPDEMDYRCEIEGRLPDLNGSLYRIGPGLYDRGPDRKRMMLDGDGMVQVLDLADGTARFRNRFVRTAKYVAEEKAGRFIYPTFSTHGSGPLRHNLGINIVNQANTTVIEWAGRIFAFDEGQRPHELDRQLETLGERSLDAEQQKLRYWAHWKLDAARQRLHLLSMVAGPKPAAHVVSLDLSGKIAERQVIPLPRSVYIHDWFVTGGHFAFLLHPAFISLPRILKIAAGRETFAHAIQWRPEKGSLLTVAPRGEGEARNLEVDPCWMWHTINAFDEGPDIVLDFIGGEMGGGLGDETSPLFEIMQGKEPALPPEPINLPRRLRVRPGRGPVEETILAKDANFELPCVSATERGLPYGQAYMIQAGAGAVFAHNLCELDAHSLTSRSYDFGPNAFCSEPVICDALDGENGRYLITQIYDDLSKRSHFAVMDRRDFMAGPVARIHLRHHVPLSFHGYWSPGP
jgi:all-trans-8'-apo-beta-carotenal 15,15'-oxygenase